MIDEQEELSLPTKYSQLQEIIHQEKILHFKATTLNILQEPNPKILFDEKLPIKPGDMLLEDTEFYKTTHKLKEKYKWLHDSKKCDYQQIFLECMADHKQKFICFLVKQGNSSNDGISVGDRNNGNGNGDNGDDELILKYYSDDFEENTPENTLTNKFNDHGKTEKAINTTFDYDNYINATFNDQNAHQINEQANVPKNEPIESKNLNAQLPSISLVKRSKSYVPPSRLIDNKNGSKNIQTPTKPNNNKNTNNNKTLNNLPKRNITPIGVNLAKLPVIRSTKKVELHVHTNKQISNQNNVNQRKFFAKSNKISQGVNHTGKSRRTSIELIRQNQEKSKEIPSNIVFLSNFTNQNDKSSLKKFPNPRYMRASYQYEDEIIEMDNYPNKSVIENDLNISDIEEDDDMLYYNVKNPDSISFNMGNKIEEHYDPLIEEDIWNDEYYYMNENETIEDNIREINKTIESSNYKQSKIFEDLDEITSSSFRKFDNSILNMKKSGVNHHHYYNQQIESNKSIMNNNGIVQREKSEYSTLELNAMNPHITPTTTTTTITGIAMATVDAGRVDIGANASNAITMTRNKDKLAYNDEIQNSNRGDKSSSKVKHNNIYSTPESSIISRRQYNKAGKISKKNLTNMNTTVMTTITPSTSNNNNNNNNNKGVKIEDNDNVLTALQKKKNGMSETPHMDRIQNILNNKMMQPKTEHELLHQNQILKKLIRELSEELQKFNIKNEISMIEDPTQLNQKYLMHCPYRKLKVVYEEIKRCNIEMENLNSETKKYAYLIEKASDIDYKIELDKKLNEVINQINDIKKQNQELEKITKIENPNLLINDKLNNEEKSFGLVLLDKEFKLRLHEKIKTKLSRNIEEAQNFIEEQKKHFCELEARYNKLMGLADEHDIKIDSEKNRSNKQMDNKYQYLQRKLKVLNHLHENTIKTNNEELDKIQKEIKVEQEGCRFKKENLTSLIEKIDKQKKEFEVELMNNQDGTFMTFIDGSGSSLLLDITIDDEKTRRNLQEQAQKDKKNVNGSSYNHHYAPQNQRKTSNQRSVAKNKLQTIAYTQTASKNVEPSPEQRTTSPNKLDQLSFKHLNVSDFYNGRSSPSYQNTSSNNSHGSLVKKPGLRQRKGSEMIRNEELVKNFSEKNGKSMSIKSKNRDFRPKNQKMITLDNSVGSLVNRKN